jgi:hypothetical protein
MRFILFLCSILAIFRLIDILLEPCPTRVWFLFALILGLAITAEAKFLLYKTFIPAFFVDECRYFGAKRHDPFFNL